jgi:hypothetical protein
MKLFSHKHRPFHLGPYPLERLARCDAPADLSSVPPMRGLSFHREEEASLVNAMRRYQAMLDAIRDGLVKKERAEIPSDPEERSRNLKSFGYYQDASQVGICRLEDGMFLETPIANPDIEALADILRNKQTKTLAAGIDVVMAELRESMSAPPTRVDHHSHAIVYLYEYPRDPAVDEPGCEWLQDTASGCRIPRPSAPACAPRKQARSCPTTYACWVMKRAPTLAPAATWT